MNGVVEEEDMSMIGNSIARFPCLYNSKSEVHVPTDRAA
jgi:hypothetical protein